MIPPTTSVLFAGAKTFSQQAFSCLANQKPDNTHVCKNLNPSYRSNSFSRQQMSNPITRDNPKASIASVRFPSPSHLFMEGCTKCQQKILQQPECCSKIGSLNSSLPGSWIMTKHW
jgi:hypothetical protein